jgi:hypothetical protein
MWRAALRPFAIAPVLVPPVCTGLSSRDAVSNAPPPRGLLQRCVVRINVHGSKDRAKDASPREHDMRVALGAYAFGRMPTTFPSSATFRHPLSPARSHVTEETATR